MMEVHSARPRSEASENEGEKEIVDPWVRTSPEQVRGENRSIQEVNSQEHGYGWLCCVSGFLFSVDVPHDVIRKTVDFIPCPLRHFGETLGFGLVLKRVTWEVDAGAVDVGLDQDIYASNAVQFDFFILIFAPVSHFRQVLPASIILTVS